jgi:hypothetical protein
MGERGREDAERGRVSAETERERREALRRIGEGGPEQHVPGHAFSEEGRVEAEAGRVAAEERRSDLRHFYARIAASIALPLAFIALLPALVGIWMVDNEGERLDAEIQQRCEDAQLNRAAIRETLLNSFSNLGYRFDEDTQTAIPVGGELDYYRDHPEERDRVLKDAMRALTRFPRVECQP